MDMVSALDEFVLRKFPDGLNGVINRSLVGCGLCPFTADAKKFKRIYGKNQVHGLIYLIACRYPDLMIDDGADSWLIPAGDAEKEAEFIFRMIFVKHAGMNSNKI